LDWARNNNVSMPSYKKLLYRRSPLVLDPSTYDKGKPIKPALTWIHNKDDEMNDTTRKTP
jgi:hypothetical protein